MFVFYKKTKQVGLVLLSQELKTFSLETFVFKKPHKSIYLNAANEANHMMKSGHDGCAAISISMPPMIAFQRWLSMKYYC